MSDSNISAIIVTGHYSAGKGPVARMLQELIQEDFQSFSCPFTRDRDLLDIAVLSDTQRRHSVIKKVGPPLVFNITSGFLHDQVHRSMIKGIGSTPEGVLQILEVASGPNVRKFDLYQSGAHLAGLVDEYAVLARTLFVDVFASKETRFRRNALREDGVSPEIMKVAATKGGELSLVAHLLGNHYWKIDNDKDGDNTHLVKKTYDEFIKPYLEGTNRNLEGQGRFPGFTR